MLRRSQVLATAPHSDQGEGPIEKAPGAARAEYLVAGWRPYAVLVGLCCLLYLPGLTTIPPIDRDEPQFAQATKQMLSSRDFILPHFGNATRFKKPVGIYWLQAAAVCRAQPGLPDERRDGCARRVGGRNISFPTQGGARREQRTRCQASSRLRMQAVWFWSRSDRCEASTTRRGAGRRCRCFQRRRATGSVARPRSTKWSR